MNEKELQEVIKMVSEIHQAMFGIKGTSDTGMCGRMNEHHKVMGDIKGRVTKLEVVFYGGVVIAFIAALVSLLK